jgi:hypothetical protein
MNTRLWLVLTVAVVGLGCGQQQLTSGNPGTGGVNASGGTSGTGGGSPLADGGGCPPLLLIDLTCYAGNDPTCYESPVCINGGWTCPPKPTCVHDGGDAHVSDAAVACPSRQQDGGLIGCDCGSDTGPEPVCVNGAWTCGPNAGPATLCLPSTRCLPPPPPGCVCVPITGALICSQDGGRDAAPGGHGG